MNEAVEAGHNFNAPKAMSIPAGATHYDSAMVHKFFSIDGDRRSQWIEGKWVAVEKHPQFGWGFMLPKKIEPLNIPKNAKTIDTVFGKGTVLADGMVDLENNPFSYRPVKLFPRDIIQTPAAAAA